MPRALPLPPQARATHPVLLMSDEAPLLDALEPPRPNKGDDNDYNHEVAKSPWQPPVPTAAVARCLPVSPRPQHNYQHQNYGLTEIYLRF
jgi:hypothetical protein